MVEAMGGPQKVSDELIDLIVATNLDPVPPTMVAILDACDRMLGLAGGGSHPDGELRERDPNGGAH